MSLQTDQRTGLDGLEALDFDYDPPCESIVHGSQPWGHHGVAYALVTLIPSCGHGKTKYYCKGFVDWLAAGKRVRCLDGGCGQATYEYSYHIVALVRP